ncbi:MAG: hypothetical protein ACHQ1G_04270 [Planctomycetota bacterium]
MRTTHAFLALLPLTPFLAACNSGGEGFPEANVVIPFDPADFPGGPVNNPFHPLTPGAMYVYEGDTADGLERVEVEVTANTKTILGVVCVEVHDRGFLDGELIEDTLDWFAQDADGNVWYFGEDSKTIENGVVVSTEGSWEAGVGGAEPGIIMLAAPAAGQVYMQENAPGIAEDRGQVVAVGVTETTPLATYNGCVLTEDYNPLDPEVEEKFYAPGVGLILEVTEDDERIELISFP